MRLTARSSVQDLPSRACRQCAHRRVHFPVVSLARGAQPNGPSHIISLTPPSLALACLAGGASPPPSASPQGSGGGSTTSSAAAVRSQVAPSTRLSGGDDTAIHAADAGGEAPGSGAGAGTVAEATEGAQPQGAGDPLAEFTPRMILQVRGALSLRLPLGTAGMYACLPRRAAASTCSS